MTSLSKKSLTFLKELSANNNRDWFTDNKPRYEAAKDEFKTFMNEVLHDFSDADQIEKLKIFRIYRDVRFSKDKTPYKPFLSASMTREGKYRRGGYYFSFQPDNHFVGGGFWNPESKDLKYIREGILREEDKYRKLIASDNVKEYYGGVQGDAVKTAPRGFDKTHPAIELIRNKQFLLSKTFNDKVALSSEFKDILVDSYKKMMPYFDFISEILVFDENGIER